MRKLLILVPILFFGIKPYQQTTQQVNKTDTLTSFAIDTLALSAVNTHTEMQANLSQNLEEKKRQLQVQKSKLLQEIKLIQQRKRERQRQRQEKREIQELINDLEKFNNRGL